MKDTKLKKKSQKCKVCDYNRLILLHEKNGYRIVSCRRCGFGVIENPPVLDELHDIYQDGYHDYISEADFKADARKKFSVVKPYLNNGHQVLDYGCGVGFFLALAKQFGCNVKGYDVSKSAAEKARKKFSITVKTTKESQTLFQKNSFDVITCFDVIEHIPTFLKTLRWFNLWLKPGGYLFVSTPNLDSWDARLLKSHWYGFTRLPQHVNYFNNDSLKRSLAKTKFSVKTLKTWGFVRSVGYLVKQLEHTTLVQRFFNVVGVSKLQVYLPMTDVMVIAQSVSTAKKAKTKSIAS